MSTIQEIEKAIKKLPREDFYRLHQWVQHRFEDEWDKEFEEDVLSGRFDSIKQDILKEHRTGHSHPFPPDEKQSAT